MKTISSTDNYADDAGNQIISEVVLEENIRVSFRGSNNRLILRAGAKPARLFVSFDGDNGTVSIGPNPRVDPGLWNIRAGQDSLVTIGTNVSTTGTCVISAVEGTSVTIGDDVMIAAGNQIRADDGHAIYDVPSGERVNTSKSILIGDHVWLAFDVIVLSGVSIGEGSVVGLRSVVTRSIPNNSIAVGTPARVVRQNIAWERPHLSLSQPAYRPDSSAIEPTLKYWNETLPSQSTPNTPLGDTGPTKSVSSNFVTWFVRIKATLLARLKR